MRVAVERRIFRSSNILPRRGCRPTILLLGFAALLAGCAPATSSTGLPAEIAEAPAVVRQAYGFAVTHPEVLTQAPCYCGCGAIGHDSNYACFVSGIDSAGEPTYDLHALGCSICVDIARDAMRMSEAGLPVTAIRQEIDQRYSAFGPSNMAPAP